MTYMQTGAAREISPKSEVVMIRDYSERYLPFWKQFATMSARKVDMALWAFGRFLKQLPEGFAVHGMP